MKNRSGLLAVLTFLGLVSIIQAQQNLLPQDTWTVGTGHVGGYTTYGDSSENERISGTSPFGNQEVLWVSDPNGSGGPDGGFNSPYVNIDQTKTYRFSVWIKKTGSSTGTSYFGPYSRNTTQTWGSNVVTTRLDGSLNTNPYFWFGDLPQLNKWYLLVGYLHPNSYSGSSQGKMYDGTTFQEVSGINFNDLKFGNGAIIMNLRSVLFGDTTNSNFQYYWRPTIHEADLTNTTLEAQKIQELLGQNANIPVTGVTIDLTNASIDIGATQPLSATVSPNDATDPSVSWSSSDTSVATVNSSGLVSAVALGNTTITVTTQDGGYTAQTTVNVTNATNTGDAISISGYNATSSVHGFRNMIEFVGQPHGAIVYNPGEANELMFGMNSDGNFYWGTGAGQNRSPQNYYSMFLNGNNGDLGIRGKLTSDEVKVRIGGWADYVFFNDYQLPSLQEVEQYIQEKGHLINIPSAAEVEANGIELGEMNKLLLEKVEELTLYMIQQDEQIQNLQLSLEKLHKTRQDSK